MAEVIAPLGFSEPLSQRMKFHANDTSGDVMNVVPHDAKIENARNRTKTPSLDLEGFTLVQHTSAVRDFRDEEEIQRVHKEEIRQLLEDVSGADHVEVRAPGILRFGERSNDSGALDNSRPARFVHIDVSDATANAMSADIPVPEYRRVRRVVHYNVWRVLTPPPQDVPLAVCDSRTIDPNDLIAADAMFDKDGQIIRSFEAFVLKYNPAQSWAFFSDMRPEEVLIFKTNDSEPGRAHWVAHGAFDNPYSPPETPPRASIEMRGIAFWYE